MLLLLVLLKVDVFKRGEYSLVCRRPHYSPLLDTLVLTLASHGLLQLLITLEFEALKIQSNLAPAFHLGKKKILVSPRPKWGPCSPTKLQSPGICVKLTLKQIIHKITCKNPHRSELA